MLSNQERTSFSLSLVRDVVIVGALLLWSATCMAQSTTSPPTTNTQAELLISEGIKSFESGEIDAAQNTFRKALEAEPANVVAHTYLGIIADRGGDLAEAERHFRAATIADPSSPSAHNNYGAVLRKLKRNNEAAKEFEASLRFNPNQASAAINLGQIRLDDGTPTSLRQAQDLFNKAYAISPDVEVAQALVIVTLRLGDKQAASNYFRDYQTLLTKADGPTIDQNSRTLLGGALLENGLATEAIDELKSALAIDPSNKETILQLARAYLAQNDVPSSGRTLEGAVARGIDSGPIYALLASVYEKSGHLENAIPAMRLAIQKDPQSEAYRFQYGMLLTTALAPDAAVIRLKEALELFPKSGRLWFAMGIAHFKAGRNDEAAKALNRSIEIDPNYAPSLVYLGMTYVEIGQYPNAIRTYQDALAKNNKLGIVNYLIADVMLKQTNADNTTIEKYLTQAVKTEPKFAPAQLSLGKLYLRQSRLNDAAVQFENVLKLDQNIAEAYYQLGLTYRRLQRNDESRVLLDKFKQITETQKEQSLRDRKDLMAKLSKVLF
ncbi:MAG TPA: tetratricopeptide repeat protein [Pyrinomonadaceae bacterium]|nr:tetratricopeptide repeat protein [Pyrinomonadaceae bacterium]